MADISKITLPDGSEYNIKDSNAVPKTRTINGKDLSQNRTLNAEDIPFDDWEALTGADNVQNALTVVALSQVPVTRTINGYDLTQNRNLTAADVGALPSDGTAHSSYTLFPTKVYSGSLAAGWYKFAEVNITGTSGRAKITFKHGLSNANYDFIGEIFVYKTNSTTMNCTMQIPYSVSGKITYFRYNIDSANTVSFYVYKHDAYGNPVFTFITSEDINGNYLDPSTYMLGSLVAETPPATALKPIYSAINRWVYNVPVSPGTNQQILSYSLGMITSASVLAKIEFANPEYIKSDCSWETTDGTNPNDNGTITLTGTCTAATTANLLILNVLPD